MHYSNQNHQLVNERNAVFGADAAFIIKGMIDGGGTGYARVSKT